MNRLVKTMVTSLAILLIGGSIALVVIWGVNGEENKGQAVSIDEIIEHSYQSPEVTTDLKDGSFVRIQFQILTDGKDAKEEISKRDFQLKNILIKELAKLTEEDFKTGLSNLEDVVQTKLNEVMTDGRITDVYTINKILQ
ncbi:flagellar basal body-associated protein FliL [Virgibacillus profundi]|uniref:Flagellar protein FliL n=1 Tax=Virgibacillus profundi TaxID=2024555 RepID=A0A2A2IE52_9BACI|nr:flagellar basal body-associated protein FliL [Virgibacillus profundi]PAV30009.1 flagellar basal body-associated protein FliL [Virgibacillus profundi]PXY54182.1 flagellar basal body-associated protein FliL [Virgibacillus profundi]